MTEPMARIARILQPIRDADASGPGLPTDRGAIAHNPAVADVEVIQGVATPEECTRIIRISSSPAAQSAKGPGRIARNDETRWIYERAAEVFENANHKFRFRVVGLIEEILIAAHTPADQQEWQVDCARNFTANRKLSMSLVLSGAGADGEAAPEFPGREKIPGPFAIGTAIVFPSFLAHRPKPVVEGKRLELLAYAYGPTFE